jgi:hypothetical protein
MYLVFASRAFTLGEDRAICVQRKIFAFCSGVSEKPLNARSDRRFMNSTSSIHPN